MEGIITKQNISILIDLGYNISYLSSQIVEAFLLQRKKHANECLVHLTTETKIKVVETIEYFPFKMSKQHTQSTFNILPL